jgi:hypothetical protein
MRQLKFMYWLNVTVIVNNSINISLYVEFMSSRFRVCEKYTVDVFTHLLICYLFNAALSALVDI